MRAGSAILIVLTACNGSPPAAPVAPAPVSNSTPPAAAAPEDPNKNIVGGKDFGPARVLIHLNKISKNAKTWYFTNASFDVWDEPLTPAKACCDYPDKLCPSEEASMWTGKGWRDLDTSFEERHPFRYSLKSTAQSLVLTAVGDLDCDGTTITYVLNMSSDANGNIGATVTRPTNAD